MFVAVRFNSSGHIDARSGSGYVAASAIPYAMRVSYRFTLDVNVATHTYNAYVMIGSMQTTIGTDLAFRNQLAPTSSLSYVAAMTTTGSSTTFQHCFEQFFDGPVHHHAADEPIGHRGQMATFLSPPPDQLL